MARQSAQFSRAQWVLVCTFVLFSIFTLLALGGGGQQAVASDLRLFELIPRSLFFWHDGDKKSLTSEITVGDETVSDKVKEGVQIFSNVLNTGLESAQPFSSEVDAYGRNDVQSDAAAIFTKTENNTNSLELTKRGLIPKNIYKLNSKKGALLLCYLRNSAAAKAKGVSKWTEYSDLNEYGWTLGRGTMDYNHIRGGLGDSPFASMNLDNGISMAWTHDRTVTVNDVKYHATEAIYNNVFYPDKGIILAINNHGPDILIKDGEAPIHPWKDDKGKPLPIVPLKQWSDVVFLTWKHLTSVEQRQNLKWVFRRIIVNPMTVKMISDVMVKKGIHGQQSTFEGTKITQAPVWPGVRLEPGEEGFNALVGAPNSYGLCWMLIQHQTDMGHKTIKSIRVFNEDVNEIGGYTPTMIMEVGDAPHDIYEGT